MEKMMSGTKKTETISLTSNCSDRISVLRAAEQNPKLMLRITVLGGGCSGFQYKFGLDDTTNEDDLTFELNGTSVVVDEISLGFLSGSIIDYKQDLGGSFFSIDNPNAKANCGCGSSFSI